MQLSRSVGQGSGESGTGVKHFLMVVIEQGIANA